MTPLRKRLFDPPNAVPDTGIDLKRKAPCRTPERIVRWREAQEFANTVWQSKFKRLIAEIAEGLDTPIVILKGDARTFPLVKYRQAAYAIMCRFSGYSLAKVATGFNRDHSTLVHALKKIQPMVAAVAAELPADASAIEWARAMKRRIAP